MNSELAQSRSYLGRTQALRGGQAPRFWRRELSREIDRLATVLRICGWVTLLMEARPLFFEQPLFGNCLAEITSRDVSQPDAAATEATEFPRNSIRPPISRSADRTVSQQPASIPRRKAETGQPTVPVEHNASLLSPGRGHAEKVSQLPRQVEGSLLKRVAGPLIEASSQKQDLPIQSWHLSRGRSDPLSRVSANSIPNEQWRHLIAYRAARTLLRDWPTATRPASTLPALPAISLKNSCGVSASPLLEGHWLTPVIGLTAPPDVLNHFAKAVGFDTARSSDVKQLRADTPGAGESSMFHANLSGRSREVAKPPMLDRNQSFFGNQHFERSFAEQEEPEFIGDADQSFHSSTMQPAITDELAWRSSPHFAPPSLTPSLPPLLPAVSHGSALLPIAADEARRSARRAELNAEEKDLSLLAAQMKRILDEEARRHGIDV